MRGDNPRSTVRTGWPWAFALFAVLLTTAPYLVAFARAGEEWTFTGFLLAVDDGNSYIAKMLSGSQGDWTFRTAYSTFPQGGLPGLFLPYLLLGKLAGGAEMHLQLVLLFHFFRIAGTTAYILAVHDFIGLFTESQVRRRVGTVLAVFGGGLGWLLVLVGQGELFGDLPLDFYSPEAFGFLAVFALPHLAVGRALMLWGFAGLLGPGGQPGFRKGLKAGLLWFLAGIFNPLVPALALAVSGLYAGSLLLRPAAAERAGSLRAFAAAAILAAPLVVYNLAASVLDPFFRAWTAQNTILSPHPVHYLFGYMLYLPWALRGARRMLGTGAVRDRLPVAWVLVVPFLIYLPFNLQRRLTEGVFVALLVLFVRGLAGRDPREIGPRKWVPVLIASVPTALLLFAAAGRTAWLPAVPAFRPAAETVAFVHLAETAPPGSVVLAPVSEGNALPAFAPVTVVIGHGPETIGFGALRLRVETFFDGRMSGAAAAALLVEQGVDFVYWPAASPPAYPGLEPVFLTQSGGIYSVTSP